MSESNHRRMAVLVTALPLLVVGALAAPASVLAACETSGAALVNGGFEDPVVAADTFTLFPAASVPGWDTTDSLGEIEIWGTGFLGVPAAEGNAFAELNANSSGTLYQDVVSTPGATMTWTLQHRAREGVDVMQVLIGDANTADVNGATGWDFISGDLSDDTTAWGTYTDDYVIPAGQVCTRFAFRAISTGSGDASVGNFLDAVAFTVTAAPEPEATPRLTPPPTDTAAGPETSADGARSALIGLAVAAGLVVFALLRTRPRRRLRSDR